MSPYVSLQFCLCVLEVNQIYFLCQVLTVFQTETEYSGQILFSETIKPFRESFVQNDFKTFHEHS